MSIYETLSNIQVELKAPKNLYNSSNLNDRFVFANQCVEDVSVDARIVIGKFNKFAHSPIVLELS